MKSNISAKHLEKLLKEAEVEHTKFEQNLGKRDKNWPKWYAEYINKKINQEK